MHKDDLCVSGLAHTRSRFVHQVRLELLKSEGLPYTLVSSRMEEPKRYETRKYAVEFASFTITAGLFIFVLRSGLTLRLRDYAESIGYSPWVSVLVYIVLLGGILKTVALPLSFYSG